MTEKHKNQKPEKLSDSPLKIRSKSPLDGQVPITIGVTGHRNIHADAIEHISEQLKQLFSHFKQQFPETPLLLLSPLAEGADQLVAQIALEMQLDIIAVLPMEKSEYQKDFANSAINSDENTAIKQSFNDLLGKAAYSKTLTDFDPIEHRDLCYANVGKWIVDQSDIVIALWDGNLETLTGGTGEVVNYALSGDFPCLEQQIESKDWIAVHRPVIHIKTVRQSESSPDLTPASHFYLNKEALLAQDKEQNTNIEQAISEFTPLKKVNSFNKVISVKKATSGYPLMNQDIENFPDYLKYIHQLYLKSDLIANDYQKTFSRYTFLFYALTSTLMITFLLYFRVFPFALVLAFYVLTYMATIVVSMHIKNSDFQKKYHLYRSIGELSRLFFFFGLSEIGPKKRASVLEHYREVQYISRKLGDDNSWVIDALKKIKLFDMNEEVSSDFDNPMELVKKHWIEDQHNYFKKALHRDERKLRILNWIGLLFFAISFFSGLILFAISYLNPSFFGIAKPFLSVAIGISAGLGGILKTYSYTMGYSELTGRYRLMAGLFGNAVNRIKNKETNRDAVFVQLWWEALMENIEWFSLKDSRLIKTMDLKKVLQSILKITKR